MLTIAILLFVLIVTTAFIAYWSDNLGKKLGKKRISLLGLRPRQTATIITIGSSLLIMLITLFSLLVVHAPLRHALLYYDRERARNRRLIQSNQVLDQQQKSLNQQIAQTGEQLKKTQQGLNVAQDQTRIARSDTTRANQAASVAKTSALAARSSAANAKSRESVARQGESAARRGEEQARGRADKVQAQFVNTKTRLSKARTRLTQIQMQLGQADVRVRQSGVQLKQAAVQLKQTESNLKIAARNLNTATRNLNSVSKNWTGLQQDYFRLNAQYAQQKEQYDLQSIAYENQKSDLQKLQAKAAQISEALQVATTGPSLILSEETLGEKVIAAALSESQVAAQLDELMRAARTRLKQIGGQNGPDLSLQLVSRLAGEPPENQILGLLTQFLSEATAPVSVRVIAARTHAVGETLINAQLVTVPVRAAFSTGETIAAATIDGSLGDAQIFNQLLALLNAGQRVAETERGVEPPLNRDTLFYASGTNERIFEALRRIKTIGGAARVLLQAAQNATTAAPLSVAFAVEKDSDKRASGATGT